MIKLKKGDVVTVNLGYVAKVRPCLVLAASPDTRRNMSVFAPLTTEIRGGETEVPFPKPPWLNQAGVIKLVGLFGFDNVKVERFLGHLPQNVMDEIDDRLADMLGL